MDRRRLLVIVPLLLAVVAMFTGAGQALGAQAKGMGMTGAKSPVVDMNKMKRINYKDREAAANRAAKARAANPLSALGAGLSKLLAPAALDPLGKPDYFGIIPNWALSPLPTLDASGNPVPGTGIRKFVDSLPGLGAANPNNLGNYLPVAVPDTTAYPGSDYYVIALVEYKQQLHSDLPPTQLRGYMQLNTAENATVTPPSYLGPTVVAMKDRPVRVKFINKLPTGAGGNLFLPVDTTAMGAGVGPDGVTLYAQNRATMHLHGGATPWISDGTPHQWTTPSGETTVYPKGVSVYNVPRPHLRHDPPERLRRRGRTVRAGRSGRAEAGRRRDHRHTDRGAEHDPDRADPAHHPGQIVRADRHPARRSGPDVGQGALGRARQPVVPARLHAEPEPR
jgi:hypothetical protein